jgi:hypothetical protein
MNILFNNIFIDIIRYLSRLIKSQRTSLWRNLKRNITVVQEDDCWIFKWTFSCSQSILETRIYWSTKNSDRYETTLVWCSTKYLIHMNKQNHTRLGFGISMKIWVTLDKFLWRFEWHLIKLPSERKSKFKDV